MILLDTNVVSETMRVRPEPRIIEWLDSIRVETATVSAVTMAELKYGIALMTDGRKKRRLGEMLVQLANEIYRGLILPFDWEAAQFYGPLMAERRKSGRPMDVADCQIAAIALANHAGLATRNTADFAGCGVDLINPWER